MGKDYRRQRPPEELRSKLCDQIGNLSRSMISFDCGFLAEGPRIASCIYIMCQHEGKSVSLLESMGIRKGLELVDSRCRWDDVIKSGSLPFCVPMLGADIIDGRPVFFPSNEFQYEPKREIFDSWWRASVYSTAPGQHISRKYFVNKMRSQDGGAHLDPCVTDLNYETFSKGGAYHLDHPDGWKGKISGDALENVHLKVIRQIGWELVEALHGLFSRNGWQWPA